jgi:hypothetical protein
VFASPPPLFLLLLRVDLFQTAFDSHAGLSDKVVITVTASFSTNESAIIPIRWTSDMCKC